MEKPERCRRCGSNNVGTGYDPGAPHLSGLAGIEPALRLLEIYEGNPTRPNYLQNGAEVRGFIIRWTDGMQEHSTRYSEHGDLQMGLPLPKKLYNQFIKEAIVL